MRGVGVVIRLDDISALMDLKKFDRFKDIMDRYNLLAVLGVIPSHLRKEKINKITDTLQELECKGWEIAQHGYTHEYLSNNGGLSGGKKSELAGLPYELQRERIKKGKGIMKQEGFYPTTFIAPWHSYDKNTINALADEGFKIVNDNSPSFGVNSKTLGGFVRIAQRRPVKVDRILFIPQQFREEQVFLKSKRRMLVLSLLLAMMVYRAMTFCCHLTSEFEGLPTLLDICSPYVVTCKDFLEKVR